MPDVTVDVEVYCATCGEGLCNQTESSLTPTRRENQFRVTPCETCLSEARDEGDAEGYDRGLKDGTGEGSE